MNVFYCRIVPLTLLLLYYFRKVSNISMQKQGQRYRGGRGGLGPPPLSKAGGLSPPHFHRQERSPTPDSTGMWYTLTHRK